MARRMVRLAEQWGQNFVRTGDNHEASLTGRIELAKQRGNGQDKLAPVVINLLSIKTELMQELWKGRIQLGKLSLLGGDGGGACGAAGGSFCSRR